MRVRMDEADDALYTRFQETPIVESEEVRPGVVFDYDGKGRIIGIEMLNVRARLPEANLKQVQVDLVEAT